MTPKAIPRIAPFMLIAIRDRLRKALTAAEAAVALSETGNAPSDDAITMALDIEVFTYEANLLLNALSLMNRMAK